ncbi:PAS domain S-box protein [Methanoculleus sp. FWC-SCC1]|uniref:histidine kinase n=1 Tax=Methanoculleus frigidifontis TaxID=2584085 RepID=A0ABT8M8J5_9EURY|nr:PAS domain S-box protein [Methanoculleus sp. FWC-SCC1]MDN7024241.1 PAS domain S-box protein [Methanoculleus sp. FWC-SCC1]
MRRPHLYSRDTHAEGDLAELLATVDRTAGSDVSDRLAQQIRKIGERAALADAILAGTANGVIISGADGRITRINTVAEKMAGSDLCGDDMAAVLRRLHLRYPDGRPVGEYDSPAGRALRSEVVGHQRFDLTCPSGETVHARVSAFPITEGGTLTGAVVVIQDVTAEVQEHTLLEGMFDALGDIVGVMRPDHTLIRYNKACYEMLGMTPDEVRGKKCYQLIGRTSPCTACATETAVATRKPAMLERWFPELGMYLECRSTPVVSESGEVAYIIEHLHDVTEQKRTEEELRRSKEQLELLLRGARDLIYRIELVPAFRFSYVSPSATALTGYTPEEMLADPELGDAMIHPDDRPHLAAAGRGEAAVEQPLVLRLIRKDGDLIWIELLNTPVLDAAGNLVALEGIARDVTDRQRAREALEQSEQRLSTLLSNLQGMAYRCRNDPGWTMEFLSEGARGMTGYAPDDIVGNRQVAYGDLIHPDDRMRVWEEVQAGLAAHAPFQVIYRIVTRDRRERWVWEQGRGIFDPGGRVVAIEGYITDITDRILAEQALTESEERYRSIFTTSHAAMLILDPETGDIVDANPAASAYYGYPHEVLTGMKITEINTLDSSAAYAELQKARSGEKRHFVFRHRLAGGEVRDVDVYSGIIAIHGRRYLYSIIHDVTDRRRTEEALRESEERFRSIFTESPIAIESYDAGGTLVDVNPAGLRMFGVSDRDEVLGFNLFADPNIPESERLRLERGETVHYTTEFDFEKVKERNLYRTEKSGTRHLDVLITRTDHAADAPHGYLALVQDITDRVRALDRIERNMEQFAVLGDHIRQPLQVILGVSGIVDDPLTGKITEEVRRINGYITELDRGWIESRKIREFLRRNEMG